MAGALVNHRGMPVFVGRGMPMGWRVVVQGPQRMGIDNPIPGLGLGPMDSCDRKMSAEDQFRRQAVCRWDKMGIFLFTGAEARARFSEETSK